VYYILNCIFAPAKQKSFKILRRLLFY